MDSKLALALTRLSTGLQDPRQPQFCLCCVVGILPNQHDDADAYVTSLRSDHKEFLNAALSFIVQSSYLDAEILAVDHQLKLLTRRCQNVRKPDMRAAHETMMGLMTAGALPLVIETLCFFLNPCLKAAGLGSAQRFSRHRWPTSIGDLLPNGEEKTLRALCMWLPQVMSSDFAEVVRRIYNACRDELLPYVAHLVDAIRAPLDSATTELVGMSPSSRTQPGDTRHPTVRLNELAGLLADVFDHLAFHPGVAMKTIFSDSGLVSRLIGSISHAIDMAATPATLEQLIRVARVLRTLGGIQPESIHSRVEASIPTPYKSPGAFGSLHEQLNVTLNRRACGWPDCPITERTTGKSLLLCAECRVVRYCSQSCQLQHWKSGHKTVCRGLRRLFVVTNTTVNMSRRDFTAACEAADLGEEDLQAVASTFGCMAVEDQFKKGLASGPLWAHFWLSQLYADREGKQGFFDVMPNAIATSLVIPPTIPAGNCDVPERTEKGAGVDEGN
ncbi:hypothetical protein EXIGLDRAFT_705941 [Exidia glandulosa HHB12029]|uniref:phytol kinase n=1 Tax=Exidia glandulosa HHB12029 TaxID=1314781 RepID=A0A165B837_EXIGL|nr:hypothetical protein EXIGLDRAFT_705941 [Exidia glandulosa HHB12029]